jgi:hypothetical protein
MPRVSTLLALAALVGPAAVQVRETLLFVWNFWFSVFFSRCA